MLIYQTGLGLMANPVYPLPPHSLGTNSITFSSVVPKSVFLKSLIVILWFKLLLTNSTIPWKLLWFELLTSPKKYMASPNFNPACSAGDSAITSLTHAKGILSSWMTYLGAPVSEDWLIVSFCFLWDDTLCFTSSSCLPMRWVSWRLNKFFSIFFITA